MMKCASRSRTQISNTKISNPIGTHSSAAGSVPTLASKPAGHPEKYAPKERGLFKRTSVVDIRAGAKGQEAQAGDDRQSAENSSLEEGIIITTDIRLSREQRDRYWDDVA